MHTKLEICFCSVDLIEHGEKFVMVCGVQYSGGQKINSLQKSMSSEHFGLKVLSVTLEDLTLNQIQLLKLKPCNVRVHVLVFSWDKITTLIDR